ncbi:pYEATS domain-containing protein [Ornithinimicrobium tianjinense]|uniref:Prokaryotic YEATS domain-containing protein n=1 Tax=Ornithinimicrobium tianjinense TaxID=1195761 RepID=A0A917F0H9_9MICO|nr:pYEATS domain-containing protein [Ornithinimicrobium tianjinense]GGF40124.1 hypothetical protein GCM10011366_04690 [Ornithinimicrobium tianjinense]
MTRHVDGTRAEKAPEEAMLRPWERAGASVAGLALLLVALWLIVDPPGRRVALAQCRTAADGCVVTVDQDSAVLVAAVLGLAGVALLVALLGRRFTSVEVAGAKLQAPDTAGLQVAPAMGTTTDETADSTPGPAPSGTARNDSPTRIEVLRGLGSVTGTAEVAVTSLGQPMGLTYGAALRDYQSAVKHAQRGYFVVHSLGPASPPRPGWYTVTVRVTARPDPDGTVTSASFFLGRAWGYQVFEGRRGTDGRLGIATQAYGPFLVLCELTFDDGSRVVVHHYCDFEMASVLETVTGQ